MVTELKQPAQQSPEEEQPQTQERAPQPQAAQADQPAGGGQLLGRVLQEQIAQAMRPVLGELRQGKRPCSGYGQAWYATVDC